MSQMIGIIEKDSRPSPGNSSGLGTRGEHLAARFLEQSGYRLVMANFTVPIGRNSKGVQVTGEIDLIALDGEVLCFVEVKTRVSDEFLEPVASITLRKQRQIIRAARTYRRIFGVTGIPHRYDAVSIVLPLTGEPKIEHFKSLWSEEKFKKRRWECESY